MCVQCKITHGELIVCCKCTGQSGEWINRIA